MIMWDHIRLLSRTLIFSWKKLSSYSGQLDHLDLNHLEHVWDALRWWIATLNPLPRTVFAFSAALQKQWLILPTELIDWIIDSITHCFIIIVYNVFSGRRYQTLRIPSWHIQIDTVCSLYANFYNIINTWFLFTLFNACHLLKEIF